jgi:hypothetical protein
MTQRIEFYFFRASPALAAALAAAWDKLPQARAGIWWRKAEGFYTFLETEDGFGDKVADVHPRMGLGRRPRQRLWAHRGFPDAPRGAAGAGGHAEGLSPPLWFSHFFQTKK